MSRQRSDPMTRMFIVFAAVALVLLGCDIRVHKGNNADGYLEGFRSGQLKEGMCRKQVAMFAGRVLPPCQTVRKHPNGDVFEVWSVIENTRYLNLYFCNDKLYAAQYAQRMFPLGETWFFCDQQIMADYLALAVTGSSEP